ncbi:hypothetical protein EJ06DRAFT_532865 [Trichodelitschia bisporula]|uniref:C2H2-type domain-containing protein n=1 Tax=Trichodelitschia bisporula TaxID=703511 RepID=A0A6G1HQ36_9PEZI|nr:hypothetical protein EJ06DRAFT_532865 [Trichodelitschia bisporula]
MASPDATIHVSPLPSTNSPDATVPLKVESAAFPPPKTDKPRPHVCTTCSRSFARLEHLKRHERSHTKEKPFECPQCTRCFARRDLLLRHQQKLHQAGATSSRPRGRRESTSSVQSAVRVRKNSIAGNVPGVNGAPPATMRPRANTISHVDSAGLGLVREFYQPVNFEFDYRPTFPLPKLETRTPIAPGLRTAPVPQVEFDMDKLFGASTINPAQLHFPGSIGADFTLREGEWGMETLEDGSSPSAMSTNSQSGFSEVMIDGSNPMWGMTTSTYDPVSAAVFPELVNPMGTMAPHDLDHQMSDSFLFSTPPPLSALSPTAPPNHFFHQPVFGSDNTSVSSAASARHSSITSVSTGSITDATRQALLYSLSQPSGFGVSKFTQPMSPGFGRQTVPLPSTADLQRYVSAYIHYFHPHMPFLHIPTLSFDSPVFTSNMRAARGHAYGDAGSVVGGGGCLILAMAAIGASYEFDQVIAKELWEAAKKMISIYLEERRKLSMPSLGPQPHHKTPLWLVQAMLLNLIYGHQCGDKVAADIATTHCAALVSLAKAAELDKPDPDIGAEEARAYALRYGEDVDMEAQDTRRVEHAEWFRWKNTEERKRTLFAVFVLSSLLVTAYNHQPKILNSELHVDLPCEENLWAAESPDNWNALGGMQAINSRRLSFADALTFLLTASQRQSGTQPGPFSPFGSTVPSAAVPPSPLKPSTFGCYVLINALHVYIWETRQRHGGRAWKTRETERMHATVEPALRAWQAAWHANPQHNLERPNPYGPLPADSIPLLDLAYVRLFVNLGRSKEAFWQRDFEGMALELGRGVEIIQHAESEAASEEEDTSRQASPGAEARDAMVLDSEGSASPTPAPQPGQSGKREKHLRKAAFYAADSLSMADKLGVTFAEFTSRELPIQAAMCTFDCAQVLAEWIATVQERVGRFLGVLGRDEVDFTTVPAIMLLEDEDCKLLEKVGEILAHADVKARFDAAAAGGQGGYLAVPAAGGFGSRLLLATAYMLDKAAVWGITKVMARSMQQHAEVLKQRAEASLQA